MVVAVLLKLVTPNAILYGNSSLLWLGLCMIVCGTVVRQIAIRTLGKYHVLTIATQGKQPVITTGIYRFVRHPSYLGAMVTVAGFALSLNSLIGSIVLVILNVSGLIYRIRLEDAYLNEQLGKPYKTYAHHTARLIPYVW
jgi:protein-S-isoprenylcysteine O-methyltransferase Ste14